MIVVVPTSGLCSRIYVLADAYELAKRYHKKLIILWIRTADCNCDYESVFSKEQFSDITCEVYQFQNYSTNLRKRTDTDFTTMVVEDAKEILLRLRFMVSFYPKKWLYRLRCSVKKNSYRDYNIAFRTELASHNNCFIEAYCGIQHEKNLRSIQINEEAVKEADSIMEHVIRPCYGIHIRRTDHGPAKKYSTTDSFIEVMNGLLDKDPDTHFYLATDDWSEQEKLVELFGDHILMQEQKVLSRSSEEGMHSSLIDMLCLSKTNAIIGSYTSVFSEFSAQYGGISLKIIKPTDNSPD
ncbi:MAG: hypothetical protein GX567_17645 [Clostridia bacterium]|nr:hypothetical protein [Clostridia bacterium]